VPEKQDYFYKLLLHILITFVVFFGTTYADEWQIEKLNNRIIISKNGEVTHGDKLRFFLTKDFCDEVQEVFTFYTTTNHKKINNLKRKVLTVKMNEYLMESEVMFVLPFLLGHSVWFDMGRYKVDEHINFFKDISSYDLNIINGKDYIATDFFDIPNNYWNMENFKNKLKEGQKTCETL
jgi:hypothetical protein